MNSQGQAAIGVIEKIVSNLRSSGYSVIPNFLSAADVRDLRDAIHQRERAGLFQNAGIGRGESRREDRNVRADLISWISFDTAVASERVFWHRLNSLKDDLNRSLFLGLWDLEGHFAIYPPDTFYRPHFDRFQNDSARKISVTAYFNDSWTPEHGGELVLIDPRTAQETVVPPLSGTLVCFMSDEVEHEVRETRGTKRLSFAGWFRERRL